MTSRGKKTKTKLPEFDKYEHYTASVQSFEHEVEFLLEKYREIRRKTPKLMREDFCGTFGICCHWAKQRKDFVAYGIDLDAEPIAYGMKTHFAELSDEQKKRVHIMRKNVLNPKLPKVDVICALNFSYFTFKDRKTMKAYFANCLRTLKRDGILVLDCFGGPECMEPNEAETIYPKFSYYWDQDSFNHVTHHAMFYIHFKRKGEKKRERVFTYDWRMWSIAELRDIMADAGFKQSIVYWEGSDRKGDGNGVFSKTEIGDQSQSWVSYIVGVK